MDLITDKNTGSLETLGDLPGEKKGISEWLLKMERESVESKWDLSIQPQTDLRAYIKKQI